LAAYYAVSPFDGIKAQLTSEPEYTVGCYAHKELPLLGTLLKTEKGEPGVTFRAYNDPPSVTDRECVDEIRLTKTEFLLMDYNPPQIKQDLWYADVEGDFIADEDGDFEFGLGVYGTAKLFVDGKLFIDNDTVQTKGTLFFNCGTVEEKGIVPVKKGQKYHVKVEFASAPSCKLDQGSNVLFGGGALRIGGAKIIDADEEVKHAASLAKDADQVIICAGLNVCESQYHSLYVMLIIIVRLGRRRLRQRNYVSSRAHGCPHLSRRSCKSVNSCSYAIRNTSRNAMGLICKGNGSSCKSSSDINCSHN
jgi:beta-glucosidase